MKDAVDRFWTYALSISERDGWRAAHRELCRQLATERADRGSDLASIQLVLGIVRQKFGDLVGARRVLEAVARSSASPALMSDARLRLAKVASQEGKISEARARLATVLPDAGSTKTWDAEPIEQSAAWRMGFLAGLEGDQRQSEKWFAYHSELAQQSHGSLLGNNLTFRNLVGLSKGSERPVQAHEANVRAVAAFAAAKVSLAGVKYVSVSKSILVPLLHEATLLFQLGQSFDGLLQSLICKRVMEIKELTQKAEGIGEALYVLRNVECGRIPCMVTSTAQAKLRPALLRQFDRKVVSLAMGTAEDRIREWVRTRDFSLLAVVGDGFPGTPVARATTNVFFCWDGPVVAGQRIELFLHGLGTVSVTRPTDPDFLGLTRPEIVREASKTCARAVIHYTPRTAFIAGALSFALGPRRVLLVTTDGAEPDVDIGLSSLTVSVDTVSASFERIRRFVDSQS